MSTPTKVKYPLFIHAIASIAAYLAVAFIQWDLLWISFVPTASQWDRFGALGFAVTLHVATWGFCGMWRDAKKSKLIAPEPAEIEIGFVVHGFRNEDNWSVWLSFSGGKVEWVRSPKGADKFPSINEAYDTIKRVKESAPVYGITVQVYPVREL